jgi:predicted metal-dependent peptidase
MSGSGEDYTYGRPSRRSAGLPGVVLPSLRRRPPRVCVIVDTSGSVSDAELGSAIREIAAVVRTLGGRRELVSVLSCDAAAHVTHQLCRAEGIPLVGGGGTDLRTGFAQVRRGSPGPDVIVVLTDGHTPWPEARPSGRTVVGLFPRPRPVDENHPRYAPDPPPAWARVVTLG